MLRLQILCLLGLLAVASSSINPILKKNYFFLQDSNSMSNQLFQTRNGIIVYVIEENFPDYQYSPSYSLINLETQNATQILSNLTDSCGRTISIFNKLHYHAATYTLIYYCSNNNTLLILDEDDYNVQQTIPLDVTEAFQEVRITTDGYSIVILGLTGLLTTSPSPTYLFKVSMQSRDIVNHVIFDHSLNSGEAVTAYASNGNSFYVLTNTVNNQSHISNTVTIYSMTLIASSYQLTTVVSFSSTIDIIINELFCIENLIVSNNVDELVIMTHEGSILQEIPDVEIIGTLGRLLYRLQLLSEYGSSDFYALFRNRTISKFSAQNQGYTSELIGSSAFNIQIAAKDQDSNSLLFVLTYNSDNTNGFSIIDLNTLKTVYQAVTNPTQIMLTPVTYCPIWFEDDYSTIEFYIFDLQTDALLKYFVKEKPSTWYYDQENYIFSYLELDQSDHCQVVQIDFQTGNIYNLSTNLTFVDGPVLIHATNHANFTAPQYVIALQTIGYKFLILSQAFGNITFTPDHGNYVDTLIVNYDTLLLYHFYTGPTAVTVAEIYSYDQSTKNFTLEKSVSNAGSSYSFSIGPKYVLAISESIGVIDVQSLELVSYSYPLNAGDISIFQGSSNDILFIMSPGGEYPVYPATLFDNGTFQSLPESGNTTLIGGAGVAGACSYWVEEGVPQNVVTVKFWDICSDERVYNSMVSI